MSKANTTILGIDPGTATTGYGIVAWDGSVAALVAMGAIETSKADTPADRLVSIRQQLEQLMEQHAPDRAAIEKLFFTKNVKTAIAVAQARGVLMECCGTHNLAVEEYTPNEVKMALTGYGNAEKQQVQAMVQRLLDLPETPKPDDVADALAVAICSAHTSTPLTL